MAKRRSRQSLSPVIARAFHRAGVTSQDLLSGQILHTDLIWQCPPLEAQAELNGVPLHIYLSYPNKVAIDRLVAFWESGLSELYDFPSRAIGSAGWRHAAPALPGSTEGERALRFSTPEGFPDNIDPYAGVIFSMEVAKVLMNSTPLRSTEMSASNYLAVLPDGREVGVRDGLPATPSPWAVSAAGTVDCLSEACRGRALTTCRYDLLAKVRSVLHEQSDKFVEFDGLDCALQTLAIQSQNRLCLELQRSVEAMPADAYISAKKLVAVQEGLALMESWSTSDRAKITSLFEILVPEVLTATEFQRRIFNMYQTIPAVLSRGTEKKILGFLRSRQETLEKEV